MTSGSERARFQHHALVTGRSAQLCDCLDMAEGVGLPAHSRRVRLLDAATSGDDDRTEIVLCHRRDGARAGGDDLGCRRSVRRLGARSRSVE